LFQSTNRRLTSVVTSGTLKIRASSITSAVPEPSSFAASPQPMPSMCAATMYISPGRDVPTFVQYSSSRGPSVDGSRFSSRSVSSGCRFGSLFTPARRVTPRRRDPPTDVRISPGAMTVGGGGFCPRPRPDGGVRYW